MNSKQYILIANTVHKKLSGLDLDYEFFEMLDEIRKTHKKYVKEATYITFYPNHSEGGRDGYSVLRPLGLQLLEECKDAGVKVTLRDIHRKNRGRFAEYLYNNINITQLITLEWKQ